MCSFMAPKWSNYFHQNISICVQHGLRLCHICKPCSIQPTLCRSPNFISLLFYDVPYIRLHISISASRWSKSRLMICSLITSAIFIQRRNYHKARALSIFLKPSSNQPTLCRSPKLHRHQMSPAHQNHWYTDFTLKIFLGLPQFAEPWAHQIG